MNSKVLVMLCCADLCYYDADNVTLKRSMLLRCYSTDNVTPHHLTSKSKMKRLDLISTVRPQGNSAFRPSHPAQR